MERRPPVRPDDLELLSTPRAGPHPGRPASPAGHVGRAGRASAEAGAGGPGRPGGIVGGEAGDLRVRHRAAVLPERGVRTGVSVTRVTDDGPRPVATPAVVPSAPTRRDPRPWPKARAAVASSRYLISTLIAVGGDMPPPVARPVQSSWDIASSCTQSSTWPSLGSRCTAGFRPPAAPAPSPTSDGPEPAQVVVGGTSDGWIAAAPRRLGGGLAGCRPISGASV